MCCEHPPRRRAEVAMSPDGPSTPSPPPPSLAVPVCEERKRQSERAERGRDITHHSTARAGILPRLLCALCVVARGVSSARLSLS